MRRIAGIALAGCGSPEVTAPPAVQKAMDEVVADGATGVALFFRDGDRRGSS